MVSETTSISISEQVKKPLTNGKVAVHFRSRSVKCREERSLSYARENVSAVLLSSSQVPFWVSVGMANILCYSWKDSKL